MEKIFVVRKLNDNQEFLEKVYPMEITIEHTDEGLKARLENHSDYTYNEVFEELGEETLFWKDMYFETFGTEWLYITDANNNRVYFVTDYHYDCIQELVESGETLFPLSNMSYEEYETED